MDYTQDFFEKPVNLTVSGQLEAEAMAMAFGKVYTCLLYTSELEGRADHRIGKACDGHQRPGPGPVSYTHLIS